MGEFVPSSIFAFTIIFLLVYFKSYCQKSILNKLDEIQLRH